jgi:hypothetical protein
LRERDFPSVDSPTPLNGLFDNRRGKDSYPMQEIFSPVTRLWAWVTATGGLPGQMIFGGIVACMILGITVWFSNRR